MTVDIRELLPLYALGILEPDEIAAVDRAVAADPALAAELASLQQVAENMVVPVAPPAHVEARLMASIGGGRYERFAPRMASLFDVGLPRAREILGLIERHASWDGRLPGVGLVHFEGGPAVATADCGFVRLEVGATFPPHTHPGDETTLVIAGRLRYGTRVLGPGDELALAANGETHIVSTEGDEPCIYAALAHEGVEIYGARVRIRSQP
jgi:hypothetical protein